LAYGTVVYLRVETCAQPIESPTITKCHKVTGTHGGSGRSETGALPTGSAGSAGPLHHVFERQQGCSSMGKVSSQQWEAVGPK
ncbi:hypothetical protein T02_5617, partial [Trichinella nativa]